jgi:hypothetical protein
MIIFPAVRLAVGFTVNDVPLELETLLPRRVTAENAIYQFITLKL